jgi:membrane associated rhomboid family serine protease
VIDDESASVPVLLQLKQALTLLAAVVSFVWVVSIAGFVSDGLSMALALVPRSYGHLTGILTMPLVHLDWAHLLTNTIPLLTLSALILLRGRRFYLLSLTGCLLTSGVLLWLFGREGAHIGASGLVFAFFGLLLTRAVSTRTVRDVGIAFGVMLLYGGLIWGVLPIHAGVSWDGHLFGMIGGGLTGMVLSRIGSGSHT